MDIFQGYAWPFYKPVDADALDLHGYHEIIKKPMDLGSIKERMDRREYKITLDFADDLRLIFTNCYYYNPVDSDVVQMAKKLQGVFEMKYARMPDEPQGGSELGSNSSESEEEEERDSGDEREEKLSQLMTQIRLLQEQLGNLQKDMERVKKREERERNTCEKEVARNVYCWTLSVYSQTIIV